MGTRVTRHSEGKLVIRKLDRLWFQRLGVLHRWAVRRGQAHCHREKLRRFKGHRAWEENVRN